MVFVKVRETYDLHTIKDKLTIIGVHTPGEDIIKRNYPGLLMQCRAYRPVSADVRIACASVLPVDPLGVGTSEGTVAPEDLFNPILYKAMSNLGMSQIEKFVHASVPNSIGAGVSGETAEVANNLSTSSSQFDIYYGLLAQTNSWKHANPQQGMSMSSLRPLVYEMYQSVGENDPVTDNVQSQIGSAINPATDKRVSYQIGTFRGASHPMPFINTTGIQYATDNSGNITGAVSGFFNSGEASNLEVGVPAPKVYVGCIIVPPSRQHQLFYRMVVEWTLEFSSIRDFSEITNYWGLARDGAVSHIMSYSFSSKALLTEETSMVDTTEGSDIVKVM